MSGSPRLPPRRYPDTSDRGVGIYGSIGQDVFRGYSTGQEDQAEGRGGPPLQAYSEHQFQNVAYSPYRTGDLLQEVQYQQQRPQMTVPQQSQHYDYAAQSSLSFSTSDRQSAEEIPGYASPRSQRKTKGHVASACVPCKRAHLRCDAQRPCSRCLSNGKEDACIDVQHKKRGRPRLRDEREPRYDAVGPGFPHSHDSMRRPLSLYTAGNSSMSAGYSDNFQRQGSSYRVLKSHGEGPGPEINPRYTEHASISDAHAYGTPTTRGFGMQEPVCAYLTADMQIAKTTQGFADLTGVQSSPTRRFHDIVSVNDRDKIFRLQKLFEDERREREPNYLPPIYHMTEEDKVIQSVAFNPEELSQLRAGECQETITFQGPDGQQRTFPVRFSLAKKDTIFFIIVVVQVPAMPQTYHQQSPLSYSSGMYPRDQEYGYPTQQAMYQPNSTTSSHAQTQTFVDPRGDLAAFRATGPLSSSSIGSTNMSTFAQSPVQEYPPSHIPYRPLRNDMQMQAPGQLQAQRQYDLQLPPIRDQRRETSADAGHRGAARGRLDIGGLIQQPDVGRQF